MLVALNQFLEFLKVKSDLPLSMSEIVHVAIFARNAHKRQEVKNNLKDKCANGLL